MSTLLERIRIWILCRILRLLNRDPGFVTTCPKCGRDLRFQELTHESTAKAVAAHQAVFGCEGPFDQYGPHSSGY